MCICIASHTLLIHNLNQQFIHQAAVETAKSAAACYTKSRERKEEEKFTPLGVTMGASERRGSPVSQKP